VPASVVLVGLESVGKSAVFRGLTGAAIGDESNFRGSTVVCRRCSLQECDCELVDTPGIRVEHDTTTTALTLATLVEADTVMLVLRAPFLLSEARTLLRALRLEGRRLAVVITFADKVSSGLARAVQSLRSRLCVPIVTLNARDMNAAQRAAVLQAIADAKPLGRSVLDVSPLVQVRARVPQRTLFERRGVGPISALVAMVGLLVAPIVCAYQLAAWLQPQLDARWLSPLSERLAPVPQPWAAILVGPYGLLTLGAYSFLWAFPVVLLLGVVSAFAEESGLHDRITAALDPFLRHVGLSGRDLVPVLTGFGCNVVATVQSRACSSCSRRACVSLIAYGSACSYQIGASLSLFGAAGRTMLFAPYLLAVFVVGLLHTRIWYGRLPHAGALPLHERAYLQLPSMRAALWRVSSVIKQFVLQALPIFLVLCVLSALIEQAGAMHAVTGFVGVALRLFELPSASGLAIVLSIFRKDGMLILNGSKGALTAGQLFVTVYLASTLTPCLVTLASVRRELGWHEALSVGWRQAFTSLVSAWVISQLVC
jgi:ferrous iron transport protein B